MRILHILRAPVGGLFRHVIDLAAGQINRGHSVGIVADSGIASQISERTLFALKPRLSLGLHRIPIRRRPGPSDLIANMRVSAIVQATSADVIHGHGAKGGALARLAKAPAGIIRVYTPHGGSLHAAVGGRMGIILERMLKARGDIYLFESAFSQNTYFSKIGRPSGLVRVIHNGLRDEEFERVHLAADALDLVYLGEMRALKGVDILIEALGELSRNGRRFTAALVGDGPDIARFRGLVERLGLRDLVKFHKPMLAKDAFALGRIAVVPSRAESLPYVVLEAVAAGKPIVATKVGGIPEIFGPFSDNLVPPENVEALATAIQTVSTAADLYGLTDALRERVKKAFSVDLMIELVLDSYAQLSQRLNERTSDLSASEQNLNFPPLRRTQAQPDSAQRTSPTYT